MSCLRFVFGQVMKVIAVHFDWVKRRAAVLAVNSTYAYFNQAANLLKYFDKLLKKKKVTLKPFN